MSVADVQGYGRVMLHIIRMVDLGGKKKTKNDACCLEFRFDEG
jgi:hypothetical protein